MMTNLHLQPKKRSGIRTFLFNKVSLTAGAVVLLVILLQAAGDGWLGAPLQNVAAPVWKFRVVATRELAAFWQSLAPERALVEDNRRLRGQVETLQRNAAAYAALEEENRRLKAQLGRAMGEYAPVLATILARPPASPYDTFAIDVGDAHGVSEGDMVVVPDHFVIGEVVAAFDKTALARLFSAPGVVSRVHVGEQYVPAEAVGKGNGTFAAQLPRDISVGEGDAVLFPHVSPLVFATVEHISVTPTDSFQTILFRTPVNMQTLRFVMVLTDVPSLPLEFEEPLPALQSTSSLPARATSSATSTEAID